MDNEPEHSDVDRIDHLISRVLRIAAREGKSPGTIGRQAFGNARIVDNMRSIRRRVMEYHDKLSVFEAHVAEPDQAPDDKK
ncbi:hypothetical protein [Maritimibacter sp. DP1N21-5]|uniref:hypothetical protein n=1 Tax=Maritimibacter sp. DP1N21-5 TaxID=2836867 RepID=UPI001C48A412|nr:hypothetical protein [Maritimibacter sp. DP1N21-5]MBV7408739.1 hypothetical protein [Maritimibacter sp. DP1N21-5]